MLGKYISKEEITAMFPEIWGPGGKMDMQLIYQRNGLLYILPTTLSPVALIDDVTRKMTAAFRLADPWQIVFGGTQACGCGRARSTDTDFTLPNKKFTNSLCIHYLAWHRDEVPSEQIEAIRQFAFSEEEPTPEELNPNAPKI